MGGTAFVFVPLLAAFAMLTYVTAVFASHYLLTVIDSTAHGNDEVGWPSESPVEWLWKPFYLGWLVFCTAAPGVLAGLAAGKFLGVVPGVLVGLAGVLAVYPVGQLSAFVSAHPWTPFDPEAVGRMAARFGATVGFYLTAAALVPVFGLGLYLALTGRYGGPFVGGPVLAVAAFVYARSVGSMMFAVTYEPPAKKRKRPRVPAPPRSPPPADPPPMPVRQKPDWDDEDDTPYTAFAAEVQSDKPAVAEIVEPKEKELKLIVKQQAKPPKWGTFLGQSKTLGSCGALAVLLAGVFGLFRLLVELNPVPAGGG